MSKTQEALTLALEVSEVLEALFNQAEAMHEDMTAGVNVHCQITVADLSKGLYAAAAIREALVEQNLAEPCPCGKKTMAWCFANTCSKAEQPAQQQEPVEYVRKMIDALYENGDPVSVEAAELLERMTRQQQEPAAWVETREDGSIYYGVETDTVISDDPSWLERPMPVYTSPPASKPWVGLTDEEMRELEKQFNAERVRTSDEEYLIIYPSDYWAWQRAIEAKLREKNA